MPRIIINEERIDCPVSNGENPCPRCGGGWPGTRVTSTKLLESAQKGRLVPEKLGCGPLKEQGIFLLRHFGWLV